MVNGRFRARSKKQKHIIFPTNNLTAAIIFQKEMLLLDLPLRKTHDKVFIAHHLPPLS
jgi:hypothetical protein